MGAVEAQGNCDDIADERDPRKKSEPDTVAVNGPLLFFEGLRLDSEPFLNPFPFPEPSYAVGDHAA